MPNSDLIQSLLKGLDILTIISSKPEGMRLNELAEQTGLKKPNLHNILRTLSARNFLEKDHQHKFHIGPQLLEIAQKHNLNVSRSRAANKLIALGKLFPTNVITLTKLSGSEARCVFRVSPDQPGKLQKPDNQIFMPYVSVSSIVLQAANPEKGQLLETVFPFNEYGIGMWGTKENFAKAKELVLKQKYYLKDNKKYISIAFVMPKAFTLGFSFPSTENYSLAEHINAANVFRNEVWGE